MRTWFQGLPSVRRAPAKGTRPFLEILEDRCLPAGGFLQTNLVSDIPGVAQRTDANLVNPWGLAYGPNGPFWVSDNGMGVSTLYNGSGKPQPLVVTVPPAPGSDPGSTGTPTGIVFNGSGGFNVTDGTHSGSSVFIFATEDGTIAGWSPGVSFTQAFLAADNSGSGAVYKGLAMASNSTGTFLYATNFHAGTVDVFDSGFHQVHLTGSFTDPKIPAGYAPFGIEPIDGFLFVTYALQNAEKHDDVAGPGHGFVDLFNTDGQFLRRFESHGALNSPWGLAQAPSSFGSFGGDVLIGNFGNGHINAYNLVSGQFDGALSNQFGTIAINGLWGLRFGNGGKAGPKNTLFFTAGIGDEGHGLFGNIKVQPTGPSAFNPAARSAGPSLAVHLAGDVSSSPAFPAPGPAGTDPGALMPVGPAGLSKTFPRALTSPGGLTDATGLDLFFLNVGWEAWV